MIETYGFKKVGYKSSESFRTEAIESGKYNLPKEYFEKELECDYYNKGQAALLFMKNEISRSKAVQFNTKSVPYWKNVVKNGVYLGYVFKGKVSEFISSSPVRKWEWD